MKTHVRNWICSLWREGGLGSFNHSLPRPQRCWWRISYPRFTRMHGAKTWCSRRKFLEVEFCLDIKSILHSENIQTLDILPSRVLGRSSDRYIDLMRPYFQCKIGSYELQRFLQAEVFYASVIQNFFYSSRCKYTHTLTSCLNRAMIFPIYRHLRCISI